LDPGNYPIRLSAGGGVCAKFPVVVCVEWLPLFTLLGYVLPRHASSNFIGGHDIDSRELSSGRKRLVEKVNGLEEWSRARSLRE